MAKQPTDAQWKSAYELAENIKNMAPWRWMYDLDNFGFKHPCTDEEGFVCVMGHEGDHFGITIYRGAQNLFKVLHATQNLAPPETALLEIEGVSLSFEDRNFLTPEDLQVIRKMGLKFRGRNAWPLFRSNQPAYLPWFISADELDFLLVGLERLLAVAPIWQNKDKYQEFTDAAKNEQYLMCIPSNHDGDIVWKQKMQRLDPPKGMVIQTLLNEKELASAEGLPSVSNRYELSMSILRNPIHDSPQKRPYFTYLMIFVEAASGFIAGFNLVQPQPSYEAAYGQLAPFLLTSLLKNQIIPDKIFVQSDIHAILLKPISKKLGIEIEVKPTLPRCEDAITSFMNFQKFK